jgi:hypothetical protein
MELEHIRPILDRMLSALESIDSRMDNLENRVDSILERLTLVEYNDRPSSVAHGTNQGDTERPPAPAQPRR